MSRVRELTLPILLVVLVAFFSFAAHGFASWSNFFNLLRQVAILGIVSAGMMPVIIAGQIDLSVGSVVSVVSCLVALLVTRANVHPALACLAGIAFAVVALMLNGAAVLGTGMPAMLCTLAAMQVWQGAAYLMTEGAPVYGLPDSMRMLGQGYLGFVPIPVVIMAIAFLVVGVFLARTFVGRYVYAVGSNAEATRLSGISVGRVTLVAFALCGLFTGIAACVQTSRLFGGFPTAGTGLEMEVVTAVVVGGVSFSGGKGNVGGVIMGVLLMGVLSNGLGIMGANTYVQLVVKGLVLLVVVGLDCWQRSHAPAPDAAATEG